MLISHKDFRVKKVYILHIIYNITYICINEGGESSKNM